MYNKFQDIVLIYGGIIMFEYKNINETKADVLKTIKDPSLTYDQIVARLSKIAENQLSYPKGVGKEFFDLSEKGSISDLGEGHATFTPRYILPNYEKLLKEGCDFLRLEPAKTLTEAINSLLIFYHHVPSFSNYPVFIGKIDKLLDPYIKDEEEAREKIKWFLIHLDRTINDSFCHANIGPEETLAGNIIIDLEMELKNSIPNMTILYDKEKTPDRFAIKCIESSLICANPAFANDKMFREEFGDDYGIASCYNGLPLDGGAFTLSRIRLNKIACNSGSIEDFFENSLPTALDVLCNFMESKIRFLVEESTFFKTNFLVTEGFVELDRFVGMFGIVGMHECITSLMEMQGKEFIYGKDEEANKLALKIMDFIDSRVKSFHSRYGKITNNRFLLHAQIESTSETTAGVRIANGQELPIYAHMKHSGLFHKYFPSGVSDHFPFESTAINNPESILDIFKGGFEVGMRYISAYTEDGDLVRVSGYLVKKSDLERLKNGLHVNYGNIRYGKEQIENHNILDRMVRTTNE